MTRPFEDFSGQFFWSFKRMDNVNYNFQIVELLYKAKKENGNSSRFNKPLILLIMAIVECSLYDFLLRINQYRNDPLPNVTHSVVSFFRSVKETDELKKIIPRIKTHNLMRVLPTDTLYSDLEHLRIVRNRLHIQNKYNLLHPDENRVFTEKELLTAQKCFEKVYDALCNVYPRWRNLPIPMADFPRPWL